MSGLPMSARRLRIACLQSISAIALTQTPKINDQRFMAIAVSGPHGETLS